MNKKRSFTAIIEREGNGYVSLCPELDIASQGNSIEDARKNLIEAIELFLETASETEILERLHEEVLITRLEVSTRGNCVTFPERNCADYLKSTDLK